MTSGQFESGVGEHLRVGPAQPRFFPASRDPVLGAQCGFPPVQGGGESPLPALLAVPGLGSPAQRQVAAWLEPAEEPAGGQIAVQPVERVADDSQLEVLRRGAERLGARHYRPEVRCLRRGGLGPDDLDHVWLLVDGPHPGEPVAQWKGELASPAGQIQQPASPGDLGAADQIRRHRCWIWQSVPFISCCCSPEQVSCEPHLVSHLGSSHSSSPCTATGAGCLRQAMTSPAAAVGGPYRALRYRPSSESGVATATTAVTFQAAIWARIVVSVTALTPKKLSDGGTSRSWTPAAIVLGRSRADLIHIAFRYWPAGGM